jgi:1,2-dihydroxy-3-keto-5-methylthiopentene dioxygenase
MSSLYVYHQSSPEQPYKVLSHAEDIASTLAEHGVRFDRWQNIPSVAPGTAEQDVISACQVQLDTLMTEGGYVAVQVISVNGAHPQKTELRARYRDEHQHPADELRAFVAGRGLLMLHIGEYVYALLCEKYDLIAIPAGTRHWFDLGENPHLVVIRLFNKADGEVAEFTGEKFASQFPELDDL